MSTDSKLFLNKLITALPDTVTISDIIDNKNIDNLSLIDQIRKCQFINWDEYLKQNIDVKIAGIDPCEHFILYGIYEGRKLPIVLMDKDSDCDYDNAIETSKIIKLLSNSLPYDINIRDIIDKDRYNYKDLLGNLCKLKRINWDAYLAQNEDVKKANIDPCEHFVNHGIYEGRKLYSRHMLNQFADDGRPVVSVIIPNYNNSLYLNKCLNSVVNQTLAEIEIIVIDDASMDESISIITDFANRDRRIKLIKFDSNQSAHMARKTGILSATGKYIMFLDPDDFYATNACETAVKYISKGYDIVHFGTYVINQEAHDKILIDGCDKYLNNLSTGEFSRDEMLNSIFFERRSTFTLWNKIYLSEICKSGARDLEDGFLPVGQDLYAFLAIASYARNMLVIEEKIYYYNCGSGVSFREGSARLTTRQQYRWNLVPYLKRICEKRELKPYESVILNRYFDGGFTQFINLLKPLDAWKFIENIIKNYDGISGLIKIVNSFYNNPQYIARIIKYCNLEVINNIDKKPTDCNNNDMLKLVSKRRVGIFYFRIGMGGIERVISILSRILQSSGFEVSIFVEERCQVEIELADGIKVYQLAPAKNDKENAALHLYSLEKAIKESKIEILFHMWPSHPQFFWDCILFHYNNIAVIAQIHSDINWHLIYKKTGQFSQQAVIDYLKCADKTICLNIYGESFLRSEGVDAEFIPNPVHTTSYIHRSEDFSPRLATIARLSDSGKQIHDILLAMRAISTHIPNAKLVLIGGFDHQKHYDNLMSAIKNLGILDNIEITGWTYKSDLYLSACHIFVSTSYTEGFHLGIAEAQRLGIPAIIYDLPITQKVNNESIITVPQGEYKSLANEVLKLLNNYTEYCRLSLIALQNGKMYDEKSYESNMLKFINNYARLSTYRKNGQNNYREAIKYMTFYASQKPPYIK